MSSRSLVGGVIKHLESNLAASRASVAWLETQLVAMQKLSGPDELTFRVAIRSLWADEGEKDTLTIVAGSLKKAILAAEAEFKKINRRPDVQGAWDVSTTPTVLLAAEAWVNVPRRLWEKYQSKR